MNILSDILHTESKLISANKESSLNIIYFSFLNYKNLMISGEDIDSHSDGCKCDLHLWKGFSAHRLKSSLTNNPHWCSVRMSSYRSPLSIITFMTGLSVGGTETRVWVTSPLKQILTCCMGGQSPHKTHADYIYGENKQQQQAVS